MHLIECISGHKNRKKIKKTTHTQKILPFLVQYHPAVQSLKEILTRKQQSSLNAIFKQPPKILYIERAFTQRRTRQSKIITKAKRTRPRIPESRSPVRQPLLRLVNRKRRQNLLWFLTIFFNRARFERQNEIRRKALHQKKQLESSHFGNPESTGLDPVSGKRNPQCGIQNPRMSWIP